jgi:hypothetical protein
VLSRLAQAPTASTRSGGCKARVKTHESVRGKAVDCNGYGAKRSLWFCVLA